MIRWWRRRFGPPPPPAVPEMRPDAMTVFDEMDAARAEIKALSRGAARDAAAERVVQAALRQQIRHGNFVADRLRGQSGGR